MNKYKNKKVEFEGITFDSILEKNYYVYLMENKEALNISEILLQKYYTIFDGYTIDGRKVRPITLKADFEIHYKDGRIEVHDTKGFETADFKIKKKLFEYRYFPLKLISYSKIDGGFIELEELKKARKKRKQLKLSKK